MKTTREKIAKAKRLARETFSRAGLSGGEYELAAVVDDAGDEPRFRFRFRTGPKEQVSESLGYNELVWFLGGIRFGLTFARFRGIRDSQLEKKCTAKSAPHSILEKK